MFERDCPIALRQPLTSRPQHQRNMSVFGGRERQESLQHDLARRRRCEVVTTNDLIHPHCRIIDDHREIVGNGAVTAPQHEIIDEAGRFTEQQIIKRDLGHARRRA